MNSLNARERDAQKIPSFIEPMKALAVEKLPEGDWLYEIKHDGYRALAFKEGKDVRLVSRNNKPLQGNRKYFGSLLVGYNSPDGLVFAGRVGTGFSRTKAAPKCVILRHRAEASAWQNPSSVASAPRSHVFALSKSQP